MGKVSVDSIVVTPLKQIYALGGDVMHAMKCSDTGFVDFGEAYFSKVQAGAVKGWKKHLRMTLNLIVPIGTVRFVFIDDNGGLREELIGENSYVRLTVPPGIWFGFEGKEKLFSLILNIADIQHTPDEVERKCLEEINFEWGLTK
jgi:dTDP-4-dehydrorhamnose 3,5-epimerase